MGKDSAGLNSTEKELENRHSCKYALMLTLEFFKSSIERTFGPVHEIEKDNYLFTMWGKITIKKGCLENCKKNIIKEFSNNGYGSFWRYKTHFKI